MIHFKLTKAELKAISVCLKEDNDATLLDLVYYMQNNHENIDKIIDSVGGDGYDKETGGINPITRERLDDIHLKEGL